MSKYNWTIDTLIDRLKLIEKLIQTETDKRKLKLLKGDYYNLQSHIEEYFEKDEYNKLKLLESYEFFKEHLKEYEFLWGDFKEFSETLDEPIIVPELKTCSLSKDDLLDITHDFYLSLNGLFFGNFMKNFYRKNDHIVFRNKGETFYNGETIALPSLKESFIEICRVHTLEDLITIIHEYMHATSVSINPKHLNANKTIFTEVDTIFIELLANDYIEKLFQDKSSIILKANDFNEHLQRADDINAVLDLMEAEKYTKNGYINNKILKEIGKRYCELENIETELILDNSNQSETLYLTAYIIAIELYYLYKIDKDKALNTLRKIIELECNDELQYYQNIRGLGIIPNMHLRSFEHDLQQEARTLKKSK